MALNIELLPDQIPHVERLTEIFKKSHAAFDMSIMGAGKTFTSTELCKRFGFPKMVVICPATMEKKWKNMSKYGINLFRVISYQSLRSRKGCEPVHGLLKRTDTITDEGTNLTTFTPTELLKDIVSKGCFFVFDEAQNIKNKNDQWNACRTITNYIIRTPATVSRFLLLSGTPIDKEEHAVNVMSMMGFIRSSKLYAYMKEEGILKLYGAQELIEYCKRISKEKTEEFLRVNHFEPYNVRHNCYMLFQEILKNYITSSMPPPNLPSSLDAKNGYYNILIKEDQENLLKGINALNNAVRYDERAGTAEIKGDSMGSITMALIKIEDAKINTFIRLAKERLIEIDKSKIAIFVNYNQSIEKLKEAFKEYNPIILHGSIPKDKRQNLIDEYQKPNLDKRVIIGNLKVCSTGIDLDDKEGNFPRYAYASPNYMILDLQQLIYRFRRTDSKSTATFRFVYGKANRKETSILNALSKKSEVLKDTLEEQVESGITFPGDYEEEIESDVEK
jgi:hypothetical protein